MTEPEEKPIQSDPNLPASDTPGAEEEQAEEEAPPEPWTEEKALEWNAYYDIYVFLGVLLLAFIASSVRISQSSIWNQLQVGRIIAAEGRPVTTDPFSYTMADQPWVNVPWLFEWSQAVIYRIASSFVPVDPTDPVSSAARTDQIAAGTLVALSAFARLLTAFFLLKIRRSGPGSWWTAICVMLAIGAVYTPAGIVMGGIAAPAPVSPGTWGLVFLAVEMLLLHNALNRGRKISAYSLLPLFLIWANVDESFGMGLLFLAATTVGLLKPTSLASKSNDDVESDSEGSISFGTALAVLVGCLFIVMVNPSNFRIYSAVAAPLSSLFADKIFTDDQISYFGPTIRDKLKDGSAWLYPLFTYLTITGVGVASFILNIKRFSLSRFLVFAVAAFFWALMIRYQGEFAIVFAATVALNGQEWYQSKFGKKGRLGWRWSLWSVGGRSVTIVVVFALIAKAITGYGSVPSEGIFGYGFIPDEFAFEAADFMKTAPIKGNVLNTTRNLGDAIVFRAYPDRKVFYDSRNNLFTNALLTKLTEARNALAADEVAVWKPILDEYEISVVMIQVPNSTNTYKKLMQSTHWVPFYDDGNVVMFGRTDAVPSDLAFFKANRLEADRLAYKRTKPTPAVERPPSPVTWMDTVFENRANTRPQSHTESSRRWLQAFDVDSSTPAPPDPAHFLLAIQEARAALASRPDDTLAFRLLAAAYRGLMNQESALLGGLKLTPENAAMINQVNPRVDVLMLRYRQRATALNYAIQTTPPPKTDAARRDLQGLNLELYQLYLQVNFADLARDRLQSILDKSETDDFSPEARTGLSHELARLNERVKQVQSQMSEFSIEQQQGPLQLAGYALSQGMPGLAIHELEEAERTGVNPALVKPQLLDLYCDTGQPEKSLEMLSTGTIEDPSFGSEPGMSAMRQGRTYFLLGNSEYAGTLWEKYAIPRLRYERASRALTATQGLIKGEAQGATTLYIELPEKIALQAVWEFDAGIARLEGGTPELAAEHFRKALQLAPKIATKPVIEYYLEKLGVAPVTPANSGETKAPDAKPADAPEPVKSP